MNAVFDASAIIAILREEDGREAALSHLLGAAASVVNVSEVLARLSDLGAPAEQAHLALAALTLDQVDATPELAAAAARLRRSTRALGLSLGDRFCLATALALGVPAITADRARARLDLGVEVVLIR